MPWTKPDFIEISLCMEVTAYVNTDDKVRDASQKREAEQGFSEASRTVDR